MQMMMDDCILLRMHSAMKRTWLSYPGIRRMTGPKGNRPKRTPCWSWMTRELVLIWHDYLSISYNAESVQGSVPAKPITVKPDSRPTLRNPKTRGMPSTKTTNVTARNDVRIPNVESISIDGFRDVNTRTITARRIVDMNGPSSPICETG